MDDVRLQAKFTPARVGALAGVSGQTIGQWARYGFINPTVYEGRPINLYSYYDVAHAVAVKWLLTEGFGYNEIRAAIENAKSAHPDWPLTSAPLGIARQSEKGDRGTLAQRDGTGYVDLVVGGGSQTTLTPGFFFQVQDTLRNGGWLAKELNLSRIEVDAGRLGGLPTLKGRRWAVQQVAAIAADEEGRNILFADYELEESEISESVAWSKAAAKLSPA